MIRSVPPTSHPKQSKPSDYANTRTGNPTLHRTIAITKQTNPTQRSPALIYSFACSPTALTSSGGVSANVSAMATDRSPQAPPRPATMARTRRSSSGVMVTPPLPLAEAKAKAATFSSRYRTLLVPGMGKKSGPWAAIQARTAWAGVTQRVGPSNGDDDEDAEDDDLAAARSRKASARRRLRGKLAGEKRGRRRRWSPGGRSEGDWYLWWGVFFFEVREGGGKRD